MAHPDSINVNGDWYHVANEQIWNDIAGQLENFIRTGRILLRVRDADGEGSRHVLLTDSSSLTFWEPSE